MRKAPDCRLSKYAEISSGSRAGCRLVGALFRKLNNGDVMAVINSNLFVGAASIGPEAPPLRFPIRGESFFGFQLDRIQLGMENGSAAQIYQILSERILSHLLDALREVMGDLDLGPLPYLPAPPSTSPEAAARRIFALALGHFAKFKNIHPALNEGEAREHFARLVDGAVEKGGGEVRKYLGAEGELKGEVARTIDNLKNLLAKAIDEFVTRVPNDPSEKAPISDAALARLLSPPPEHESGELSISPNGPASGSSSPTTQMPIPPPESTVLAYRGGNPRGQTPRSRKPGEWATPDARRASLGTILGTYFAFAALLGFPLKAVQMALYKWVGTPWAGGLAACFQMAFSDALFALALYGLGCSVFMRRDWILRPGFAAYSFLALAGVGMAFAIRWAYTAITPLTPELDFGIFRDFPNIALPLLAARLTRWWLLRPRPVSPFPAVTPDAHPEPGLDRGGLGHVPGISAGRFF